MTRERETVLKMEFAARKQHKHCKQISKCFRPFVVVVGKNPSYWFQQPLMQRPELPNPIDFHFCLVCSSFFSSKWQCETFVECFSLLDEYFLLKNYNSQWLTYICSDKIVLVVVKFCMFCHFLLIIERFILSNCWWRAVWIPVKKELLPTIVYSSVL